jgi:putative hydrolase
MELVSMIKVNRKAIMKLIGDMHTHTLASGHAYGTIRENAKAAQETGLEVLGIAEHAPGVPGTCDPFYYCNYKVLPHVLYGVQMFYGSEINILNDGTLSLKQKWIDCLDYAIAGIHCSCYHDEGREKNTENAIQCMKNEKVRIMSHPDDDRTSLNYENLVKAAKKYHVALEVNNSSLVKEEERLNCRGNYIKMLELCEKEQVPVVISSDAHDPSWVGRFSLAEELIEQEHFNENLILNTDKERLIQFLTEKKS